ncbi:hypothetical protein KKC17_04135 [Patescibacteria group bacterium]|nr:hypothetical protein [Patescibacteria group bacterium]
MLEDIIKFILPIVFTESVPYILFEYGFNYQQATIISLIIMALKLVVDVFFIRFVFLVVHKIIKRAWRLLKIFFWKKNIFYTKSLSRKNLKVIQIVTFFGRLSFIYHKPIKAANRLKNRLVNWMVGVGAIAIFFMSVIPALPILAATPVLAYVALTVNRPWYKFNNWLFIALFVGSEIKIFYTTFGIYNF